MPLLSSAQTNVHHRRFNNNSDICFSSDFTPLPRLFIKGHLQQLHQQQQQRQQQQQQHLQQQSQHRLNYKQGIQSTRSPVKCAINFAHQLPFHGEEAPRIELQLHSPEILWHRRKFLTRQVRSKMGSTSSKSITDGQITEDEESNVSNLNRRNKRVQNIEKSLNQNITSSRTNSRSSSSSGKGSSITNRQSFHNEITINNLSVDERINKYKRSKGESVSVSSTSSTSNSSSQSSSSSSSSSATSPKSPLSTLESDSGARSSTRHREQQQLPGPSFTLPPGQEQNHPNEEHLNTQTESVKQFVESKKKGNFNLPVLGSLASRLVQLDEEKRCQEEQTQIQLQKHPNLNAQKVYTLHPSQQLQLQRELDSDLDLDEVDLDLFILNPAQQFTKVNETMRADGTKQPTDQQQRPNQSRALQLQPSVRHSNNTTNSKFEAAVEKTSFTQPPGSIGYRTGLVLNSSHLNSKMSSKYHPNEPFNHQSNKHPHHQQQQQEQEIQQQLQQQQQQQPQQQREKANIIAISSNDMHPKKPPNLPSMLMNSSSSVDLINSPAPSHHNIHIPLTPKEELSRFRRQFFFECTSLALMTLAGTIIVILPFLMMSVWLVPLKYARTVRIILAGCFGISILLVICAGFLGNIYWYMDPIKRKWKWGLHCGSGPSDHFWGETLFYTETSKEYPGSNLNLPSVVNCTSMSPLSLATGSSNTQKNHHRQLNSANIATNYYAKGKDGLINQLHVNLP